MRGGEPDAQRLLQLAVQEISEAVLPDLSGDARYRLRLVLNAIKTATAELRDGPGLEAVRRSQLTALLALSEPTKAAELVDPEALEQYFQAALRRGDHDGDPALYESLVIIAEARAGMVR